MAAQIRDATSIRLKDALQLAGGSLTRCRASSRTNPRIPSLAASPVLQLGAFVS
jgi:hypothetical protein